MAVQVRELIDEMIEIKEDMKPKEIKINLEKKRRYYEILDKRNKVELIKDSKFIPSKQSLNICFLLLYCILFVK